MKKAIKTIEKDLKSLATKTPQLTKTQLGNLKGGFIVTEDLIDA